MGPSIQCIVTTSARLLVQTLHVMLGWIHMELWMLVSTVITECFEISTYLITLSKVVGCSSVVLMSTDQLSKLVAIFDRNQIKIGLLIFSIKSNC